MKLPQINLIIYELSPGLCRSCFMTLRGKILIGPLSLSLQAASIMIAGMACRWTEPEWLRDYTSPLLLLFPPCGCWWYSELRITCSPHSLACVVNLEERCHLRFYVVHKSTLLPRAGNISARKTLVTNLTKGWNDSKSVKMPIDLPTLIGRYNSGKKKKNN